MPLTTELSSQELMKNLIAVHVTDYLPINNKQIAGNCGQKLNNDTFNLTNITPEFRHTLHWSLGNVAPEHDGCTEKAFGGCANTYSKRKYALVTRLENLAPQLLNIFAYDTIIIGNYNLSTKDWLVAPRGTIIQGAGDFNIFYYNPEVCTLEEAVQSVIVEKLNGWKIRFTGIGDLHDKAYLDHSNVEINNPVFLSPIITELNVSFGTHELSISGWQSSYICALETIGSYVMALFLEVNPDYLDQLQTNKQEVAIAKIVVKHALKDLKEYAEKLVRLPTNVMNDFLTYLRNLKCWFDLLEVEQMLNNNQRTLVGAGVELRNKLLELLSDRDSMIAFAENNLNSFQKYNDLPGVQLPGLVSCLSNIPWSKIEKDKHLLGDEDLSMYLVFRLLSKGGDVFVDEDLDSILSGYCERMLANKNISLEPFMMNILKELCDLELNGLTSEKKALRNFVVSQSARIKTFGKLLSWYNKPEILCQMPSNFADELMAINDMLPHVTQNKFLGYLNTMGLPIGYNLLLDNPPMYSSTGSLIVNRCKFKL